MNKPLPRQWWGFLLYLRMDISISINEDSVYNDVYVVTGHTAKALDQMDKVSATEDESNVLSPFLLEASSELSEVISAYGSLSYSGEAISVDLSLPSNWKQNAKSALEKAMHNFLVNGVCAKWFAISNREDVKFYMDKQSVNASNIIKLLCERTRPTR